MLGLRFGHPSKNQFWANAQRLVLALGLVSSTLMVACSQDPPLETVPGMSLQRFQGKWYEIAKLARSTQADCYGTIGMYTMTSDTAMTLTHQCNLGSLTGPEHTSKANGVVSDPNVMSKLSVDFGGGFYGDYWVIDLGQNYEYAVVGHPSRQYLWILSRTPTLDSATLAGIVQRAQNKGFDTSKLQYTTQAS
jgi:apolipoprotein D and lipocalin family protein